MDVPGLKTKKWSRFETDFVLQNESRLTYAEISAAILKATGVLRTETAIKSLIFKMKDGWYPGRRTKRLTDIRKGSSQRRRRKQELRKDGFWKKPKDPSVAWLRPKTHGAYKPKPSSS